MRFSTGLTKYIAAMVNAESDKGIYKRTLFFCSNINLTLLQKRIKIGGQRSSHGFTFPCPIQ